MELKNKINKVGNWLRHYKVPLIALTVCLSSGTASASIFEMVNHVAESGSAIEAAEEHDFSLFQKMLAQTNMGSTGLKNVLTITGLFSFASAIAVFATMRGVEHAQSLKASMDQPDGP
jgi:hypothetical protein